MMTKSDKSPEINRLKALFQALDCSPADVAEQTGVAERTIKNTIWYNQPIGGPLLRQLHRCFNVSIDWLLFGHGEMFIEDGTPDQSLIPDFKITDTKNAQDVLIVAASAIEQAMNQCGAKPNEDYTLVDLFDMASKFAVCRYKENGNNFNFFG